MARVEAGGVARRAMSAVEQGAREDWIELFALGATLEDPVDGTSPRVGRAEIAEFWDSGISMFERVAFEVHRVHEAPQEVLVLCDVSVTVSGGAHARYDAAVHYQLDEKGKIAALRAFWDLPAMLAQLDS